MTASLENSIPLLSFFAGMGDTTINMFKDNIDLLELLGRCNLDHVSRSRLEQALGVLSQETECRPLNGELLHWEDQLATFNKHFPKLCSDGLREMGDLFRGKSIWNASVSGSGRVDRYLGLAVFPLPGKTAAKLGLGDIWEDAEKEEAGEGLWLRLYQEVLFPALARETSFSVISDESMTPTNFWPGLREIQWQREIQWLRELETRTPGDYVCLPYCPKGTDGRHYVPAWFNGCVLLANTVCEGLGELFSDIDVRYQQNWDAITTTKFCKGYQTNEVTFEIDQRCGIENEWPAYVCL